MWNAKFKKLVTYTTVLCLQPMLSPGSLAWAKRKSPPKAYSFIAEGGKASQGECDGERKIPRKLKRLKEYSKAGSYMGSELQTPEIKGKADEEMWKHFFRAKPSCNSVLAKTPSSIKEETLKETKTELPPEESVESENDSEDGENEGNAPSNGAETETSTAPDPE
ncbi:hypothetical protein ACLVWU_04765 [Bdellovibrio sp. HCB290]|uniref:hypothetical protein n=1 Tax=Bdellovibrio sp. HCB290 TaxID=3394356 RepID=UPI0039B50AFB